MKPTLTAAILTLASMLTPTIARAELIYTADGRTLYGQVRGGGPAGTVVIDSGEGSLLTLQREEVSGIDFGAPTPNPPASRVPEHPAPNPPAHPEGARVRDHQPRGTATVLLRNGDRLIGALRQIWPPTLGWEETVVVVPPAWVAGVRVHRTLKGSVGEPGPTALGEEKDRVELANGDRIEGQVEGLQEGRLQVRASIGRIGIDPARIAGLTLARGDAPLVAMPGIQARVETQDGDRLTGEWLSLSATDIRLKPPWGTELVLPVERATRLTVLNGRLVFLSDMRPVEAQEVSYFDTPRPFRTDRSQGGRPLRLGGRAYSRGMGVHARSALTYALAGSFKTFAASVGIDTEVGNGGSVRFRVLGDDRPLFESPVLRGGDAPVPITVDVSGVLLLRLEVDEADHTDVADHADWVEARLLK